MTGAKIGLALLIGLGVAVAVDGVLHLQAGANAAIYVPVLLAGLVIIAVALFRFRAKKRPPNAS